MWSSALPSAAASRPGRRRRAARSTVGEKPACDRSYLALSRRRRTTVAGSLCVAGSCDSGLVLRADVFAQPRLSATALVASPVTLRPTLARYGITKKNSTVSLDA